MVVATTHNGVAILCLLQVPKTSLGLMVGLERAVVGDVVTKDDLRYVVVFDHLELLRRRVLVGKSGVAGPSEKPRLATGERILIDDGPRDRCRRTR